MVGKPKKSSLNGLIHLVGSISFIVGAFVGPFILKKITKIGL
jgi:hypothetical protein